MGTLARRALNEDVVLAEWSASDANSYKAAAEVFRRETEAGYTAVRVEGVEHHAVTTLPRDAELVLLTTAMGGG
jgi:hypothetical protein